MQSTKSGRGGFNWQLRSAPQGRAFRCGRCGARMLSYFFGYKIASGGMVPGRAPAGAIGRSPRARALAMQWGAVPPVGQDALVRSRSSHRVQWSMVGCSRGDRCLVAIDLRQDAG
jgi:hypothetical protein